MAEKRVKIIKHNNVSVKFEVDSRYSPLESIGTGAYGVVCAAKDNRSGQRVAIKKIPKVFDIPAVAKRTYRELKILRHLRHDNIISILDVMQPDEENFDDVYVVLDLMESDLHHIIHSVQPLSNEHIKYFLYQILCGLKYIHSANVLHRDLKPSNLLINQDCELKIGDFGMARGLSSTPEDHSTFMTEYVATRWYRAPELMLSFGEYSFSIDMWSVGCIFAEMLARRHLFPGKNYLNQLQLILSVVGTPSKEYIQNVGTERVRTYLQNLPERQAVDLSVLFPEATESALDFLNQLLVLDPDKRLSASEALSHPYLTRYHDPKEEPVCSPPFDFSFEKKLISKEDLRKAICEEIGSYHKCKLPIPSHDIVKDALIKMMKDRDQEKAAQGEDGGSTSKEKDGKSEGPSKSRKDEKKKKRPAISHSSIAADKKKKKIKLEPQEGTHHDHHHRSLTEPGGMNDKDKEALERWKKFQEDSHVGRNGSEEDVEKMMMIQQHHLMRRQIEEQGLVIANQQKIIHEQHEYIMTLKEQKQTLIRECRQAGLSIPDIPALRTPSNLPKQQAVSAAQHFPLPPTHTTCIPYPSQHPPPPHTHALSQPPPSSPAQTLSPAMTKPPPPSYPSHPQLPPPPPPPPPPHLHHGHLSVTGLLSQPPLPPCGPALSTQHYTHPGLSSQHPLPQLTTSAAQISPLVPHRNAIYATPNAHKNTSLVEGLTFSPLTSSEFREIEHKDQPPGYSALVMRSYDEELNSILDIAGLPTGSGAGYGVGVADDELPALDLSNLGTNAPIGPASASLLQDWLDINQLDPDDIDVLQKELEAGAPDSLMNALNDL